MKRYQGLIGFLDCLAEPSTNRSSRNRTSSASVSSPDVPGPLLRVKELYRDLRAARWAEPLRYVLRGGSEFFLFDKRGSSVRYWGVPDSERLYAELSAPRLTFSPVVFDRNTLEHDPLPVIYGHNRPGIIQVFCQPESGLVKIYILDERGSLFQRIHEALGPQGVLGPYALLLGDILQRYTLAADGIEYYLMERSALEGYAYREIRRFSARSRELHARNPSVARETARGTRCLHHLLQRFEFSSWTGTRRIRHGGRSYHEAASQRERYPIYITGIDLPLSVLGVSSPDELQTIISSGSEAEDRRAVER